MPTYSYRCTKCGHEYEKFQKMADKSRPRCPECKSKGERVISGGSGIVFKGSGFYLTDYGRAGQEKPTSGEKKESGGEGGKNSESKSAESKKTEDKAPAPKGDKS